MDESNQRKLQALESDLEWTQAKDVSSTRLGAFNAAPVRRSKQERDHEAALKKEQQEAQEASKAYEDFVAAFGVEEEDGDANGRKGPGSSRLRSVGKGFVRSKEAGEGVYNPLAKPIPTGPASFSKRPTAVMVLEEDEPALISNKPPGKKQRGMDSFLEELKRDQQEREDRLRSRVGSNGSVTALAAREHAPVLTGSYDQGDPLTTNVHVSNLPMTINEQALGMMFAEYGPVGSVKIMWPRNDGPGATSSAPNVRRMLSGFVAMMRRPDAERAAKDVDGMDWGGSTLRTSWGKLVPLPPSAIYELEGSSYRNESSSRRPRSPERYSSSSKRHHSRSRSRSRSYSPERHWPTLEAGVEEDFLRTVAKKVKEHGENFESVIRAREKDNPKFAFFSDRNLPSYHYFRMMLIDRRYRPPTPTMPFADEGNADIYSSDSAEDSERERTRKGKLGKLAQKRFESMLRNLTSTREKIGRAMAFALEHADAAETIATLIVESLTIDSTPIPRKLARLHLLSDLLHNASSSLPNAWIYRSTFSALLPIVFTHLGIIFLAINKEGRMKGEWFRLRIVSVIEVWETWCVLGEGETEELIKLLSGGKNLDREGREISVINEEEEVVVVVEEREVVKKSSGFKKTGFQPAMLNAILPDAIPKEVEYDEDLDGDSMIVEEVVKEENIADDDVDGEDLITPQQPFSIKVNSVKVVEVADDDRMMLGDSDDDIF